MKKTKIIIVTLISLLLLLSGCSASAPKQESSAEKASSAAVSEMQSESSGGSQAEVIEEEKEEIEETAETEPEQETNVSGSTEAESIIVGDWELYVSISKGTQTVVPDSAKSMVTLSMKDDKTFDMGLNGDSYQGTWQFESENEAEETHMFVYTLVTSDGNVKAVYTITNGETYLWLFHGDNFDTENAFIMVK